MTGIRVAVRIIGTAYALLVLLVVLFALSLRGRVDLGTAYLAAMMIGVGEVTVAGGLLAGSVLGTVALLGRAESRRLIYILAVLSGWIGGLLLGSIAWEFWSNSIHPRVGT